MSGRVFVISPMFKPLRDLVNRTVQLNVNQLLFQIFEDRMLQVQILDLNTESQLYTKGVDALGNQIGEYSFITKAYYKPIAAAEGRDGRTDHITLKDTGEFYQSFTFVNEPDQFKITADTLKGDGVDLAVIYGETILGLTNESIAEIKPEIKDRINEAIRRTITGQSL